MTELNKEDEMEALIINVNRDGYTPDQCPKTLTVGNLISILSDYDEDMPVYLGSDRRSYGWFTYGHVSVNDFDIMADDECEAEE